MPIKYIFEFIFIYLTMKKVKLLLKILNWTALLFILIYTPLVAMPKARNYEIYTKPTIESKIYTVWHIETFEGGSKARINYIKNLARTLEKQNDGVLFYIKTVNPNDLSGELAVATPDIISFGTGVGKSVLPTLSVLDNTYNVRDNLISSATFNNKLYAIPYIASGYAVITHGVLTDNIHADSNYINIEPILTKMQSTLSEQESGYEAYKDFVYNKDVTLIGTGRDVFRVDNLNNTGRTNASITPIDYYSDLMQYIGLSNVDDITLEFLNLALSDSNQMSLSDYHLYSTTYNSLYIDGIYRDMENALTNVYVPNIFA